MKNKGFLIFIFCVFLSVNFASQAQSVTIDFEGVVNPDDSLLPSLPYSEDGFTLENLTASGFGVDGIFGATTGVNSNGSSIFAWCSDCVGQQTFLLTPNTPTLFSIQSLDASNMGLDFFADGMAISAVGNFSGGGTVSQTFNIIENTWTTFNVLPSFTNLVSLEITNNILVGAPIHDFAIDNLVLNPIPEPATIMLFGIGLLGLAGVSRKKNNFNE